MRALLTCPHLCTPLAENKDSLVYSRHRTGGWTTSFFHHKWNLKFLLCLAGIPWSSTITCNACPDSWGRKVHRSWCLYCEYLCILKSNYLSYLLYPAPRAWVIVLCFAWSPYRLSWKTEHKNYGVHVERIFLQNNPKSDEVKFQKKPCSLAMFNHFIARIGWMKLMKIRNTIEPPCWIWNMWMMLSVHFFL